MAGRRRFGRVRKLRSGRWQARYRAPDGQDHRAPETFKTKTAADRWLVALETDLIAGSGSTRVRVPSSCRRTPRPGSRGAPT